MSTILHRLAAWADSDPHAKAQVYRQNGEWKTITAREYCDRVYWLALFLESQGMKSHDVGTIFSYNCPQWAHMDLAPLLIGGKSAGIYPNSPSKDIHYVLQHTESRFLCVQNQEYYFKIVGQDGGQPLPDRIEFLIVFDGDTSFSPKAISYETALAQGKKLASAKGSDKRSQTLSEYLRKLDPDAPAFLIYTSGTTGAPKAALLSQDNLAYASDVVVKHWRLPQGKGSIFSFLPLCHIAEKLQNIGAGISQHYTAYFCSKFENVGLELPMVQPNLLLCVPRVWEKMMEGVIKKVEGSPLPVRKMAHWAFAVGARVAEAKYSGKNPDFADKIQYLLAQRLILSKVKQALGLEQTEAMASGAAALAPHVVKWFRSLGLEINEDFGQTESSGVLCLTVRDVDCVGTVGKAPEGIEVRLAEDGEILTRGRHVFRGYYKDAAATSQVLENGWLHTGDIGEWDQRGMLKIRGRKKEVMKTSGGKMIAPVPIEEALKAAPIISQVCMVGDGRKYLSALITLSEAKLAQLAKEDGVLQGTVITASHVIKEVAKEVDQLNVSLASYSQIKKFAILSHEFSIANGEMTPTLKMKRNVIEARYKEVIEQLYESS